ENIRLLQTFLRIVKVHTNFRMFISLPVECRIVMQTQPSKETLKKTS
ncbi:hypothetical protein PSYMO_36041, partial [Pseudomonas amygdali pv. mori str. 301020]